MEVSLVNPGNPQRREELAKSSLLDRSSRSSDRSGIDYLGRYGMNKRAQAELRKFGNRVGLVVDRENFSALSELFDLVPERDNKSEWSPVSILRPLSRYGDRVPERLIQAVCAMERGRDESCAQCSRSRGGSTRPHTPRKTKERLLRSESSGAISDSSNDRHVDGFHRPEVCETRRAAVSCGQGDVQRGRLTDGWRPEVYGRAVSAVLRSAGSSTGGAAPYSAAEVLDNYVHPQSYAGAPYFCRNEDVPRERILGDVQRIQAGQLALPPFLAGRRVQHGELVPKGRLVWMASLATTVLATTYSKRCYEGVVGRTCFAFGETYRDVGAAVTAMQSRKRFVYGLDFSAFDASIPARVIDDAFGILKTHLSMDADQAEMLDRLISDFIHSRIVLPDGTMWRVHRGVPSGSAFTSLVDSVANLIILQYIWIRLTGHELDVNDVKVLGDDSIVASNWYLSMSEVTKVASELGMVLNPKSERVSLGGRVPFLGHEWKCGRPRRDPQELAKRLAFPEHWNRFLTDERYSLLRLYSFTADSVDGYNLFFKVVDWTSPSIEQIVLNKIYSVDMPSLMPELSERERLRAMPGRFEFRARVERNLTWEISKWNSLRLLHLGRQ